MINGYQAYAEDFFVRNPKSVIHPLRMTQSALESIFSRQRGCGGANNNPNLHQYARNLGCISFQNDCQLAKHANIEEDDAKLHFHTNLSRTKQRLDAPDVTKAMHGRLVMDEMKISGGWQYSGKSFVASGLLCAQDDLASMRDVFKRLDDDEDPGASDPQYVLQFLWRDEDTNLDVIGPWFPWKKNVSALETSILFWKVVKAFSQVNMQTHAVIFDGSSINYGFARMNQTGIVDNPEQPWCRNPHNLSQADAKIFLIVDPAHMVKNFRNQLHASQSNLAKSFVTQIDADHVERLRVFYGYLDPPVSNPA
jgi:hypothetical protein